MSFPAARRRCRGRAAVRDRADRAPTDRV